MEGELWKWTNYWNGKVSQVSLSSVAAPADSPPDPAVFSGWQSRWFLLEDGILSYYKSCEEVSQGCKGSMNVSVCEIVVSHADSTRLDLVISGGEQVAGGGVMARWPEKEVCFSFQVHVPAGQL
jgi:pleckstrin family protein A (phosphoinositide binding specific) protein 8